jgi:LmbE family N-acetylglucosaminyl deacetylase
LLFALFTAYRAIAPRRRLGHDAGGMTSGPVAIAIGAHPDDIEFSMAGTLLLLARAGYQTHYLNLASGHCGSRQHPAGRLRVLRRAEAREAACILGATFHASLVDDLEILYELKTLRRLAAILREVKPWVVLTHSPQDYMEDHMNACRLAVTAAFSMGMPNFKTAPPRSAVSVQATIYHAMPHGLRDGLRRRVVPGAFVNTTSVHSTKLAALAAHRSQQDWLDASQGMNSYLQSMDDMSRLVGRMSRRFPRAEGWRRHLHLGFSATEMDPLREALKGDYRVNARYERELEQGR